MAISDKYKRKPGKYYGIINFDEIGKTGKERPDGSVEYDSSLQTPTDASTADYYLAHPELSETQKDSAYNTTKPIRPNIPMMTTYRFNPEGESYDYETAKKYGIEPDETGHYPSRVPETGQLLKGKNHPTFNKTIEGEKKAGYEIYKGDDEKYYSRQTPLQKIIQASREKRFAEPYIQETPIGGMRSRTADPITQTIVQTLSEPIMKLKEGGENLAKGKILEGGVDAVTGALHGAFLPFTVPFGAATEGLKQTGYVGKEIAGGLERTMNIPFDLIKGGSELVNKGLNEVGIDTKKLSKVAGINPTLDEKINNLITEIGGLYLLKKAHTKAKEYVEKKTPLPVFREKVKQPEVQDAEPVKGTEPVPELEVRSQVGEETPLRQPDQELTPKETPVQSSEVPNPIDVIRQRVKQKLDEPVTPEEKTSPEVVGAQTGRAIKMELPSGEEKIFSMGEGSHKEPMTMAFRYIVDDLVKKGMDETKAMEYAEDFISQAAVKDKMDIGDVTEGKFTSTWKKPESMKPTEGVGGNETAIKRMLSEKKTPEEISKALNVPIEEINKFKPKRVENRLANRPIEDYEQGNELINTITEQPEIKTTELIDAQTYFFDKENPDRVYKVRKKSGDGKNWLVDYKTDEGWMLDPTKKFSGEEIISGQKALKEKLSQQPKVEEKQTYFTKEEAPPNVKENFKQTSRDFKEVPGAKENVPKELYKTLEDGTKVYLVDGTYIRDNVDIDFTLGGHEYVYPRYIPKGEVWLDKDINKIEIDNTLRHELTEREKMVGGENYNTAHEKANKEEIAIRQRDVQKPPEVERVEQKPINVIIKHEKESLSPTGEIYKAYDENGVPLNLTSLDINALKEKVKSFRPVKEFIETPESEPTPPAEKGTKIPTLKKAVEPTEKQPYEMTFKEYIDKYKERYTYKSGSVLKGKAQDDHKFRIEQALKEGKQVPEEVLADYPDLSEKYGKKEVTPVTEKVTDVTTQLVGSKNLSIEAIKSLFDNQKTVDRLFDLKESRKTGTPSEKRKVISEIQKETKKLREQGIDATFEDNNLFIEGQKIYQKEKPQFEKIEDVKIENKEAETSFENLSTHEVDKQTHLADVLSQKKFLPDDLKNMLPKGFGQAKFDKAVKDIKDNAGAEQSKEAQIFRDFSKEVESRFEKDGYIEFTNGQRYTKKELELDLEDFAKKRGEELGGNTSFEFGENVPEPLELSGESSNLPKKKPFRQESLFEGTKDNRPVFPEEGKYKGKGIGEEGTPLFEQPKEDKGQLSFEEPIVKETPESLTKGKEKSKRVIPQENYDQAKKNLSDPNKFKLGVGVDPIESAKTLKDLATVGAYHFENGLRNFSDWSKKMIEEFGEKIKQHLRDIWNESKSEYDLVALHNLSTEKLYKANELGGLPVPSIAITKKNIPYSNFGDITLVADKNLYDPKIKTNKVFDADVYSPRVPSTKNSYDWNKLTQFADRVKNNVLKYYGSEDFSTVRQAKGNEIRSYIGSNIEEGRDLQYNESMMIDFLAENHPKELPKTLDDYEGLRNTIKKHQDEFDGYIQDTYNNLTTKRRMFKGYDNNGNQRYSDYTLDNVVREMKKGLQGGENFFYGAGSVRAHLAERFKNVKDISEKKSRLVTEKEMESVKDYFNNELSDLMDDAVNNYTGEYSSPRSEFEYVIIDAAKSSNPKAILEKNGFGEMDIPRVKKFLDELKNAPTQYFESKIQRGVGLNEFIGAVIPEDASPRVKKVLNENGINKITTYKRGDEVGRINAIDQFPEASFGRIVSESLYNKAKQNIIKKSSQLNAGIDPTLLKDLVTIGAYHFENGVRTFADYSKKMVEEFGEKVKPYLRDVWDKMKEIHPEMTEKEPVRKFKVVESGEKKQRGLSTTTEAKAIASKIAKGFENLPEYDVRKTQPQIDKAAELITSDVEKAKNIVFGKEGLPEGSSPDFVGFLYKGLEDYAVRNTDSKLMKDLSTSTFLSEKATGAGQLIQSLRNQDPTSPVAAMKSIIEAREKSWGRTEQTKKATELENQVKTLEEKLAEKEEQIQKIQAEQAFKKIKREEGYRARTQKRTFTKEQLKEERSVLYQDLFKEISSFNAGVPLSGKAAKIMLELTKSYAKEGYIDAEAVVDVIYQTVKDKIEGITQRDIRDTISKYGQSTQRTKNELVNTVKDLRQQMQLASKIEDLESGKLPFKKRTKRIQQSEELQTLKEELKAKLDELGITEQQNLKKAKELIQKRIEEYNTKISQGDFKKTEKTPPMDEERIKLQKDLEDVRKQWKYVQESLGEVLTPEEAKHITELSKKIADSKQKMESVPRRKPGQKATQEEMDYGRARVEFAEYIDNLKESAEKLTFEEFKSNPPLTLIRGIKHIPGITKSAKATLDNSGIGNQGVKVLYTHPTIWAKNALQSFKDIVHTFGGKNVLAEVSADIVSRPNYDKYLKDKVAVGVVEEAFPDSRLIEKIPFLGRIHKAADAAFTAFAYRNRADLYDLYTEIAKKAGHTETTGLGLGKLVNSLTGRGDLGSFEKVGNEINVLFFSPRFLKSHFDVLTAYSGEYLLSKIKGKESTISPFVRKQAAINLLKIIGSVATIMATAKAMGADVETDPRSSDFGKIKVGNTRFNFTGGMSSLVTLGARIFTQSTKSTTDGEIKELNTGKFGSMTTWDAIQKFMEGKLSPVAGVVRDISKGQTYGGERVTLGGELKNLTVPLPITNYEELAKDPNSADKIAAIIADGLGIFTSTYSNDPNLRKVKNALLKADKEKLNPIARMNFRKALREAFESGAITKEQKDEFETQFNELQKDAPKAKKRGNR